MLERLTKAVKLQVNRASLTKSKRVSDATDDDRVSAKRRKGASAAAAPAAPAAPAAAAAHVAAEHSEHAQARVPTPTTAAAKEGNDVFRPASAASSASNPRETPVEEDFDLSESEDGSGDESSGNEE